MAVFDEEPKEIRIHILIDAIENGRRGGSDGWQRPLYDYEALTSSKRDRVNWIEVSGALVIGAAAGAILAHFI